MKKKGFTLIELLAVIVVLSVIALILVPKVTTTIKNSKKSSAEVAGQNYIRAVEISITNLKLSKKSIPDGVYNVDSDGNLTGTGLPNGKLEVKTSGSKPSSGRIVIKKGAVTSDSTIVIGDYNINYDSATNNYVAWQKEDIKTYVNGEVVYFNVTSGEKCTDYKESQSYVGVNSGCMKFYAFNDHGESTVNLLLDHNTTAKVAWNSSGSNTSGPKEVLEQLKTDTSSWKGTTTPINYNSVYYNDYKARLITMEEVAQIVGNKYFTGNVSGLFYFDTNTTSPSSTCKSGNTSGCKYGWLYDRTSTSCTTVGCLNNADKATVGYWTVTPNTLSTTHVWTVDTNYYYYNQVGTGGGMRGLRPVITVFKFKLI